MRKLSEKEKEAQIAWFQNLVESPQAKAMTLDRLEKAYEAAIAARFVDIIMNCMLLVSLVAIVIYHLQVRLNSYLFMGLAFGQIGVIIFWDRCVAKPWQAMVDARIDTLEFICKKHGYKEPR
jgi:hypothetical protein